MSHAYLPLIYWDEICSSVVYLINRLPNHSAIIPYTKLFHKDPDYSLLCVIGCQCFPHICPYNSNKLESRAIPCIFLGYATTQKGYRCLHLPTNKLYISRHVQFDETYFPFKHPSLSATAAPLENNHQHASSLFLLGPNTPLSTTISQPEPISQTGPSRPASTPPIKTTPHQPNFTPLIPELPHQPFTVPSTPADTSQNRTSNGSATLPKTPPDPPITSSHPMTTRRRDNTLRIRTFPNHVAFSTTLEIEPISFTQANSKSEWRHAMSLEMNALATNNTWTLIPP